MQQTIPAAISKSIDLAAREEQFRQQLREKRQLQIVEMGTDGNCLFRAISH